MDIVSKLKEKFDEYGLMDIAESFCESYKLAIKDMYPEIRFDNDALPSDDCFKTLVAVKQSIIADKDLSSKRDLTDLEIKRILEIPYTQVQQVKELICDSYDYQHDVIESYYGKNLSMYFITPVTVKKVFEYLSEKFENEICKHVFLDSLILGYEETTNRIDTLIACTGIAATEILYETYCRNGKLGYLLYPYYTNPKKAIKYLSERLDKSTVAHILKTDFWYLYAYKDDGYQGVATHGHDQEYVDRVVSVYKAQENIAIAFHNTMNQVTKENAQNLWEETFLPRYSKIKDHFLQYPPCPLLTKSLYGVITMFDRYEIELSNEFAFYSLDRT